MHHGPLFDTQALKKLVDKCGKTLREDDPILQENEECCICLCEYEVEDKVIQFNKCPHFMHEDCLLEWLKANPICPYCKANKLEEIKGNDTDISETEIRGQEEEVFDVRQEALGLRDDDVEVEGQNN